MTNHTLCQPFLNLTQFKDFIWQFYRNQGRTFAWRLTRDPYHIVISEVMLQQTQTQRVAYKYDQFITLLPTFKALADASSHTVLQLWQGLGYNRRGKYLHELALIITNEYQGILPNNPGILLKLPGIGPTTAASICAFAFNNPTVFIETNIRTVFIHSFFQNKPLVDDKEIIPLIKDSLDQHNPREWYYALMDYGVFLKKNFENPNRKSRHYTAQSKFEGSDRQIRGAIIRLLTKNSKMSITELCKELKIPLERVAPITDKLLSEGLIHLYQGLWYHL